jgi:hypothetical protein
MKQSKTSWFIVDLGLASLLLGFFMFIITDNPYMILMGLSCLSLLWIMGIQYDLYELGAKKKDG